jgi:hypothetical protein
MAASCSGAGSTTAGSGAGRAAARTAGSRATGNRASRRPQARAHHPGSRGASPGPLTTRPPSACGGVMTVILIALFRGSQREGTRQWARCPHQPGGEADRGSQGGRRAAGTPPGRPDAAGVPWPASGSGPEPRARARGRPGTLTLDHPSGRPRQAARPRERHGRADHLQFSSPRRRRTWLPRSVCTCPGIKLSDAGGQGERTRSRLWAPARRANRP